MRPEQIELLSVVGEPTVHPDGTWAVVAVSRPSLAADAYVGQLWRVDLVADASPRRLTRGVHDSDPRFSPDGRLLAFIRVQLPPDGRVPAYPRAPAPAPHARAPSPEAGIPSTWRIS